MNAVNSNVLQKPNHCLPPEASHRSHPRLHRNPPPAKVLSLKAWKGFLHTTGLGLSVVLSTTIAAPLSPAIAQSLFQHSDPTPYTPPPDPNLYPVDVPAQIPAIPAPITAPVETPSDALYRLGSGDSIGIDIFDVPEFSGQNGQHTILVDGSINLPWIGQVFVGGLTLNEAANLLETRYAPFINDPLIVVTLVAPRPLRIAVVGEVNRPGSYTLDPAGGVAGDLGGDGTSQWTTAIQAIQQAGGITQLADIRNIQIRRPLPDRQEEEVINVDLWDFLQSGSLNQDLTLRDGDTVLVPTVTVFNTAEAQEIAGANFSPEFITTYVVGEVESPGELAIRPNTSLNQAILAAGGREDDRAGRVDLIRLNPDGSVDRRTMHIDWEAELNEETNPALRNNDIVFVRRSGFATVSDILEFTLTPVRNILGILDIFRVFDANTDNTDNNVDDEIRRRDVTRPDPDPVPVVVP